MMRDYTINLMKHKDKDDPSATDETLSEKVRANEPDSTLYTSKEDGAYSFLSINDFYDSCALVLEGNNSLLVSLYDENKSRLEGVIGRFAQAETNPKGYVFSGDPSKMFDILGTFREHEVSLRGGYFDFYTGPHVDVHKSLSEERFSDLVKEFLNVNDELNLITNDIYDNKCVDDPSLARKSIEVYTSPRFINVYVSGEQYEPFMQKI